MNPILLDTCAILWLGNGDPVSQKATDALNSANKNQTPVYASPFSAWEIGNLAARNRIRLPQLPQHWFEGFLNAGKITLAQLSPDILISSSFLPEIRHKDPADRILISTARTLGLTIMTRDQKILDYAESGHVNALLC